MPRPTRQDLAFIALVDRYLERVHRYLCNLTRKIELPHGARVVEAYRGCRPFDVEGRPLLISQHYYPAHTREPLVVRWTMP